VRDGKCNCGDLAPKAVLSGDDGDQGGIDVVQMSKNKSGSGGA
jgi:hypothetical protein